MTTEIKIGTKLEYHGWGFKSHDGVVIGQEDDEHELCWLIKGNLYNSDGTVANTEFEWHFPVPDCTHDIELGELKVIE